jgi:hypothetical protein
MRREVRIAHLCVGNYSTAGRLRSLGLLAIKVKN